MAKRYSIEESTLTNIANAIRNKTESSEPITVQDMADKIEGIKTDSGENMSPYEFVQTSISAKRAYTSSSTFTSLNATVVLPAGSKIVSVEYAGSTGTTTSSSGSTSANANTRYQPPSSITDNSSGVTITYAVSQQVSKYYVSVTALVVRFTLPGIYLKNCNDGVYLYADETVKTMPVNVTHRTDMIKADLSNSKITSITSSFQFTKIPEILLPPSLTTVGSNAFASDYVDIIDMTKHTTVPTLSYTSAFTAHDGLEIRVPASLYSQWIEATNWSSFADYIVAV